MATAAVETTDWRCTCGGDTAVVEAHEAREGMVRRERQCVACGRHHETYELSAGQVVAAFAPARRDLKRAAESFGKVMHFFSLAREAEGGPRLRLF